MNLPPSSSATTMHPHHPKTSSKAAKKHRAASQYLLPGRDSFNHYYPPHVIQNMLENGHFYRGVMKASQSSSDYEAYVTIDTIYSKNPMNLKIGEDVYICGRYRRNRAIKGDIVVMKIIPDEKKATIHNQANSKRNQAIVVLKKKNNAEEQEMNSAIKSFLDEQNLYEEGSDGSSNDTEVDEEDIGSPRSNMYASVVGILSQSTHSKISTGKVWCSTNDKKYLIFKTDNSTENKILIPTQILTQFPTNINHGKKDKRITKFILKITSWPVNFRFPIGTILAPIEPTDFIQEQRQILLYKNAIFDLPFSQAIIDQLPTTNFKIPKNEFRYRLDLRKECIFTIDPESARDLDDAVSCWRLENGSLCVGVHIADVTNFVKTNSPLDMEARNRGTTTYLVERAIPMLPEVLSSNLCSLLPGKDRLTLSVMWQVSSSGEMENVWFGRTIIHSVCKLSYKDVQNVLDGNSLNVNEKELGMNSFPPIGNNPSQRKELVETIQNNLHILNQFAKILRHNRFLNGSLSIQTPTINFVLNDLGVPTSHYIYEQKQSNKLVEELMLLANISVANKIWTVMGNMSLLRRHSPPLENRIEYTKQRLEELGYFIDTSSSGALQKSLENIADKDIRNVVYELIIPSMKQAEYFCPNKHADDPSLFRHYALNVPIYTHFTSPIRRYADIIVHRLLLKSIEIESTNFTKHQTSNELLPLDEICLIANHCNARKDAARIAQEQSTKLYLYWLLKNNEKTNENQHISTTGIIQEIKNTEVIIYVPKYGTKTKINLKQETKTEHYSSDTKHKQKKVLKMYKIGKNESVTLIWETVDVKVPNSKDNSNMEQLCSSINKLHIDESNNWTIMKLQVFDKIKIRLDLQIVGEKIEFKPHFMF
ncbi:hypothetical protein BB558_000835 [Smittium angustum]|uniref:RNB domain-containing protein n=1 Tax=Smittium angustum TaxID=133377 RepID=A0A2U1JD16_SMIAN|nr:hypothetical protein BB558_000835 [Smittium angustum]